MEIKHKPKAFKSHLINGMAFRLAIKFWRTPKFLYLLSLLAMCVNSLRMLKRRDIGRCPRKCFLFILICFVVADSSKLRACSHEGSVSYPERANFSHISLEKALKRLHARQGSAPTRGTLSTCLGHPARRNGFFTI